MLHIVGSPRSGTTLISQCLNAHTSVCIPHDIDFVVPMAALMDRVSNEEAGRKLIIDFILNMDSFDRSLGEYLSREQVGLIVQHCEYAISSIVKGILSGIATIERKPVFGYKSTKDLDSLSIFLDRRLFVQRDKIIHVIRDCRDVMTSLMSVGWISQENTSFGVLWASQNILLNKLMHCTPDYHLIKYEKFVDCPQSELEKICDYIGVDFMPRMLDARRRSPRYQKMENIHKHIYSKIDHSRVGVYKRMPNDLVTKYTYQAFDGLKYFGYQEKMVLSKRLA